MAHLRVDRARHRISPVVHIRSNGEPDPRRVRHPPAGANNVEADRPISARRAVREAARWADLAGLELGRASVVLRRMIRAQDPRRHGVRAEDVIAPAADEMLERVRAVVVADLVLCLAEGTDPYAVGDVAAVVYLQEGIVLFIIRLGGLRGGFRAFSFGQGLLEPARSLGRRGRSSWDGRLRRARGHWW